MNRLMFVGLLAVGATVKRTTSGDLPPGVMFLLTTPKGRIDVVEQDRSSITIKNSGDGAASYMIFAVDQAGMRRIAALRGMVEAFAPKRQA